MTVPFFDVDVDPIEATTIRIYLVGQEPVKPRTDCIVPVLQWLADKYAANPRLENLLRLEIVAVDPKHVQHLLFDSAATSTLDLLHPLDILLGRTRRPAQELLRRIESGLSIVVIPGDAVGTEISEPVPFVNDLQRRLVWIETLKDREKLTELHTAWGSSRTVIAEASDPEPLKAMISSFIVSVVEAQLVSSADWVNSSDVSELVRGMSYVVG